MTSVDISVPPDGRMGRRDLERLIARLRSLLARVASGEIVAPPGFEQRLFGAVVAFEFVAAREAIDLRALVQQLR
jgi:hypothetical protein